MSIVLTGTVGAISIAAIVLTILHNKYGIFSSSEKTKIIKTKKNLSKKEYNFFGISRGEDGDDVVLKGYKKTADGKTTSYFTQEIDEKTKALIGDIAPKRLDPQPFQKDSVAGDSCGSASPSPSPISAWNKAGTWEEKSYTKESIPRISELIEKAYFRDQASNVTAFITSCTVEGMLPSNTSISFTTA